MKNFVLFAAIFASLLAITGCGGNDPASPQKIIDPQTNNSPIRRGHVLDFGTVDAVITEEGDHSQPNLIQSTDLQGINGVEAKLRFNSGAFSTYYLDANMNLGFCTNGRASTSFYLEDGTISRVFPEQLRVTVKPNTDYVLKVSIGLECDSFELKFGLMRLLPGH